MRNSIKKRVWEIVEVAQEGNRISRAFDIFILTLIFLNVVAVIVGTVQSVQGRIGGFLSAFETVSVIIFTAEYLARVWSCTTDPRYQRPIRGRVRFALSPMALIDLAAFLPFYLPFVGVDLRFARILRLLRITRVAKVGRYYASLSLIVSVVRGKKEELVLTTVIMLFLLVMAASCIYYCENPVQPEQFSSIPASMWWAVVTLTTVGYGDVYPITVLGKIFAAIVAVLGIGMFALPTGIIGSGFVEEIQKRKAGPRRCPHCGKDIKDGQSTPLEKP